MSASSSVVTTMPARAPANSCVSSARAIPIAAIPPALAAWDSGRRVLEHYRITWLDTQFVGGGQEDLGVRLTRAKSRPDRSASKYSSSDFDVFMPGRWEKDWERRRAARIPSGLGYKTKPQLAIGQLKRLLGTACR